MYYRGANGAIIVFDITNTNSFKVAKEWVVELKKNSQGTLILSLVGNKSDLDAQRSISRADASQYSGEINAIYFETSAKLNQGIDILFLDTTKAILDKMEPIIPPNFSLGNIEMPKSKEELEGTGCC